MAFYGFPGLFRLSTASLLGTQVVTWHHIYILSAAIAVLFIIWGVFVLAFWKPKVVHSVNEFAVAFGRFFYANFLKPHGGDDSTGQQAALESFYKAQVRKACMASQGDRADGHCQNRLGFMMPLGSDFFAVVRICWVLLRLN